MGTRIRWSWAKVSFSQKFSQNFSQKVTTLFNTTRNTSTKDGNLYGFGKNEKGQLGLGGGVAIDMYESESVPKKIEVLDKETIVDFACGSSHTVAINDKGQLWMWGHATWLEPHLMTALEGEKIVKVACGENSSFALNDAGEVFSWGKGLGMKKSGALGQGDSKQTQPKRMESLSGIPVQLLAANGKYGLALTGLP